MTNFCKIIQKSSNKVLDGVFQGQPDNSVAYLYNDGPGNGNQEWSFYKLNNGYYKIVQKSSNKVLDGVFQGQPDNSVAYLYNDGPGNGNQEWSLNGCITPTVTPTPTTTPVIYKENYGMLSKIVKFISINATDSTGKVIIGIDHGWCNAKALFIGDFNGDGKKDLLCSLVNGESYIMLSQGTSFLPMGSDPDGRIKIGANDKWCSKDIRELHIGDFNNDKKSDLLCRVNVHEADEGSNYVMLSTGSGFEPMTNTTDGAINIGKLGKFCFAGSRLVVGNFDGQGGDDLFCNNPTGGSIVNMLMISNGTSFVSVNANILGAVQMGQTDACQPVWCIEPGSKIMTGDFNGDGKADLLCNANGVNKIMLSMLPQFGSCDFKPISTDGNGTIAMGQGTWPLWCDTSKSTLVTADVDEDTLSDLVCNDHGVNQIMLCKKIPNNNYRFDSFNINNPKDLGNTSMAGHDKWCPSQNILAGDINGDTLDDIWCNQGGNVLGLSFESSVINN